MRKLLLTTAISATLFSAFSTSNLHAETKVFETETGQVAVTEKVSGLDAPWAMEMLPNGKLLVTEVEGGMVIIDPENSDDRQQVANVPEVYDSGQGGLLDVAIDPDFKSNRMIYFTFSELGARSTGTAVASAKLDTGDKPSLSDVNIIYSMKNKSSGGRHFGSRIVFDRDGNLFFTIGDRGDQPRAQDPKDAAGSVLRITKDGGVPEDNPFADGKNALPEIWSIGHRNAQGATLHPETGELWTLSHGARGGDEINKPKAGKNYGWPLISYGTNYSGSGFSKGASDEGLEQPKYYWDPSIAPSGLDFYMGDAIPEWKGNLFAGALKFQLLSRLVMDGDKVVSEERLFEGEYGRIREVRSFADGALWFLSQSEGAIYRVSKP